MNIFSNIFVLNLKKDIEKKRRIERHFKQYSLEPKFVHGIDGKYLGEKEFLKYYSPKKTLQTLERSMTGGEIACALGHIAIYKRIVRENINIAFIFEDDIQIEPSFFKIVEIISYFLKKWDLVLLGHHSPISREIPARASFWFRRQINNHQIVRFSEIAYGSYGYMITLKGAKKLLLETKILCKPIDHYTGSDSHINLYGVLPVCVNIASEYQFVSNLSSCRDFVNDKYKKFRKTKHPSLKRFLKFLGLLSFCKVTKAKLTIIYHKIRIPKRYH